MIDTQEHPRILDTVLLLAPRDALIALRGTSMAVRDHADTLLGRHLFLVDGPGKAEPKNILTPHLRHPAFMPREGGDWLAIPTATQLQAAVDPSSLPMPLSRMPPTLAARYTMPPAVHADVLAQRERCLGILGSTKIVDYMARFQGQSFTVLDQRFPHLNAYRCFPNEDGGYGGLGRTRIVARTFVVFHHPYNIQGNGYGHLYYSGAVHDPTYSEGGRPEPPDQAIKTVYHIFHSDKPYAGCFSWSHQYNEGKNVRDVVFVFSPALDTWPIPDVDRQEEMIPELRGATLPFLGDRARDRRRVGDLIAQLEYALRNGQRATVVGLKTTPPEYLGYRNGETDIVSDIKACLAYQLLKAYLLDMWMDTRSPRQQRGLPNPPGTLWDMVKHDMLGLRFITREAYASELSFLDLQSEGTMPTDTGVRYLLPLPQSACIPPPTTITPLPARRSSRFTTHLTLASFPHIFDMIFSFADAPTLVALRSTCRTAKSTIDTLFQHLVLVPDRENILKMRIHNPLGPVPGFDAISIRPAPNPSDIENYDDEPLFFDGPYELYFGWGLDVPPSAQLLQSRKLLLSQCRVFDFADPLVQHMGPMALGMVNVQVVRMNEGYLNSGRYPVPGPTFVVYTTPRSPIRSSWSPSVQRDIDTPALCTRAVFHVLHAVDQPNCGFPTMRHPVDDAALVFTPFQDSMHPLDYNGPTEVDTTLPPFSPTRRHTRLVELLIGMAGGSMGQAVLKNRGLEDVRITCVNLHTVPPQWLGLGPTTSVADMWSSIVAPVRARFSTAVQQCLQRDPAFPLWMERIGATAESLVECVMGNMQSITGEEYLARGCVTDEACWIELVPGKKHRLLPSAQGVAAGEPGVPVAAPAALGLRCPHCTFTNAATGGEDCKMCGLPLSVLPSSMA